MKATCRVCLILLCASLLLSLWACCPCRMIQRDSINETKPQEQNTPVQVSEIQDSRTYVYPANQHVYQTQAQSDENVRHPSQGVKYPDSVQANTSYYAPAPSGSKASDSSFQAENPSEKVAASKDESNENSQVCEKETTSQQGECRCVKEPESSNDASEAKVTKNMDKEPSKEKETSDQGDNKEIKISKNQQTERVSQNMPTNAKAMKIMAQPIDEASYLNLQIHDLAKQLISNFTGDMSPDSPIAVSTFVDLNNLYKTSPFGRYIAEQLMGELQRAGFRVVEVRKTDSLLIKEHFGEYGLSRDAGEIAREASARFILVGTYITRGNYIMINARVVCNQGNMLVSSGLKILKRDKFLDRMLWPTVAPDTSPSIQIPIKEFGQPTEVKIISGS